MLEQCYSTNGEQAADREERPLVPVYARKVAVAPAGPNLQATIRRSSPHIGPKRVAGAICPRRQGFQKIVLH